MSEKIKFDSNINEFGYLVLGNDKYSAFLNFNLKERKQITVEFIIPKEDDLKNIGDIDNCYFETETDKYNLHSFTGHYNTKQSLTSNLKKYCLNFQYCFKNCSYFENKFEENKFNKIYLEFKDLDQFCNIKEKPFINEGQISCDVDIKMTENCDNSNLTKKYFFKLDENLIIDLDKSFPEPIYSPLVVVNAKNMLNFDSECKEKSNELNKKIEESNKKIIKEFIDNNPENGVIIKEKNVYQIIITTNETEYFKTPKEVEDIVLDVINIFSILCDKRIDIDSISLGSEDGKIASMVFNRPIFNDKKQIGNNAIPFQAFIDNFENIFKNYFYLKEHKSWLVEIVNFLVNMDEDYFLRYSNTLYAMLFENCCNVFTYDVIREVKKILTIDFNDENEFIKYLEEILSKINENYNNKYSDFTGIIHKKFVSFFKPNKYTFEEKIKQLKKAKDKNEFCKKSIDEYCKYKLLMNYINNKEKVSNFFVKIVEKYNIVIGEIKEESKKFKKIIIVKNENNKNVFENTEKNQESIFNLFRELRNYFSHYYDKEDEAYKYIKNIVENNNHELTNLTILLKYIIISEFLLELGFNKEITENYFKNNVNFINTI